MVGVGFAIGDVLAAATLATQLWTACFSKMSAAHLAYARYGEQLQGLGGCLHDLWKILSEHERRRAERNGGRLKVNSVDLNSLAIIIGDFKGTLERANKLMDKYAIFKKDPSAPDKRGYVLRMKWSIDAEQEVYQLTQDCAFHMTKIQLMMEPLKIKLQLDVSDNIQSVRDDLSDLMARFRQIETLIRNCHTGGHNNIDEPPANSDKGPTTLADEQMRRPSASVSRNLTPRRLHEKFEETMHRHPRFRSILPEIPIEDWCEAAAWWIESGVATRDLGITGLSTVPAERYLNLLKAAWLLATCEESMVYRRLERDSLWTQYVCRLTESIAGELSNIRDRGLSLPDEDSLLRLPDGCFDVWLNNAEKEVPLSIRDERPGEEKILELTLQTTLDPDRFTRELLVFRKDEGTMRLCDTTENFENGSRSSEEFIVKCAETQLVALYITAYNPFQNPPVLNVMMNNRLQQREYSFKSSPDLHNFQRAIVGSQVIFEQPGSRSLCAALSLTKLGSDLKGSDVRVQLWLDKPLARLGEPSSGQLGASPNLGATSPYHGSNTAALMRSDSLLPTSPRPRAAPTFSSQSVSSSGSSSSNANQEVLEFRSPRCPRLLIYFKAEGSDKWAFLQIQMVEQLVIRPKRCCRNNTHRLFASPGETCCKRTVLESTEGTIEALMFSPSKGEPEWALDILQANLARARNSGGRTKLEYVAIEHKDESEKQRFGRAFEACKNLSALQKSKTQTQIKEAQQQAYRIGGDPGSRRPSASGSNTDSGSSWSVKSIWR